MAQFKLKWDNSAVLVNPNATAQRAAYRQKSVGGVFNITGFTPANDLAKSVTETLTPILPSNIIFEFKVQSVCTENGPTDNDNGVQEGIIFGCITPGVDKSSTTSTITLDLNNTDVTKVRFTIKKTSDNSVIGVPVIVVRAANFATLTAEGLTESTSYYWQIELYSVIAGIEVISSSLNQLGTPCGPYLVQTDAPPFCNPVISLTASAIELL